MPSTKLRSSSWEGVYEYSPRDDGITVHNGPISFSMHIEMKWFGRFNGYIDEADSGIPERAIISGTIRQGVIKFSKRYPSLWIAYDDKIVSVPDQKPHTLKYSGNINVNEGFSAGRWESKGSERTVNGQKVQLLSSVGTWSLKLVKSN